MVSLNYSEALAKGDTAGSYQLMLDLKQCELELSQQILEDFFKYRYIDKAYRLNISLKEIEDDDYETSY